LYYYYYYYYYYHHHHHYYYYYYTSPRSCNKITARADRASQPAARQDADNK